MINKRKEGPETPLYDLHQQSLFVLIHVALLHDYCCTQILKIEARKKKKKKKVSAPLITVGWSCSYPPRVMSDPLLMEANRAFRLSAPASPAPPVGPLRSAGGGGPGGGGGGPPAGALRGAAPAEATAP